MVPSLRSSGDMRVHLRATIGLIGLIGLISFSFMINQEVMQQLASHLCARSVVCCHGNILFPARPSLSFFFFTFHRSCNWFFARICLSTTVSFIYFISFFVSAKFSFCRLRSNSTRCLCVAAPINVHHHHHHHRHGHIGRL